MQYNVSLFVDDADKLCEDIYRRGKIPVVCGGTGFYIRNFLYGVAQTPVSDETLRKNVSHFLYDLIARSALHAQTLVGVIVNRVLSGLTDAQLNSLVYDKVEPDLIWIRMNGSIVGAGIGLLLFCVMSMAGLK